MKKLTVILCAAMLLLSGCGGGSIYSNYREIEELTVIRTLGIDATDAGYTVSAATGTGNTPTPVRLSGSGGSIDLAMQSIADHSTGEEIFYAHSAYLLVGQSTADGDLTPVLDYVKHSTELRIDMPLFIVSEAPASELVLNAGGEDFDATEVLRSVERVLSDRGDCPMPSAADISADLAQNGSALVCAVVCVKSGSDLTAIPDGCAVIKFGRCVGHISAENASGISLIRNESGPFRVALSVGGDRATVQLGSAKTEIRPVLKGGRLTGIDFRTEVVAALTEGPSAPDIPALEKALEAELTSRMQSVLDTSKSLRADFLQLGSRLELQSPQEMRGMRGQLQDILQELEFSVSVTADISRSSELSAGGAS